MSADLTPPIPSPASLDASPIDTGHALPDHTSPVVSPTEEFILPQSDGESLPFHETQVEEEIREAYGWLCTLLAENERRAWGTAYRDFVDVRLLLSAVQGMGMEEVRNNRVGNGTFQASTGDFTLSIWDFIDILQLKHSSGTWRNKFTAYFRIKQLYIFAQHSGGETQFETLGHSQAWEVVRVWMDHQQLIIGDKEWVTRRYGSTELRPLLQGMIEEVCHGKCVFFAGLHAQR